MVLLKRKQSSSAGHSRKSSVQSLNSSTGSASSSGKKFSLTTPSSSNLAQGHQSSSIAHGSTKDSHLQVNTDLKAEMANKTSPGSPGSRLSSAPVFSGSKRLSLALRSFSSTASSVNSTSGKNEEDSQLSGSSAASQSSSNNRNSHYSNFKTQQHGNNDHNRSSRAASIAEEDAEPFKQDPVDSKLIFDWDVTNPKQWSSQRVVTWLQLNDFSTKWISFFRRQQIHGDAFLKLMAYDNFQKYENFLPSSNTSSYARFQHLLKRTMEQNVIHQQHSYSRSTGSIDSLQSKKSNKHSRTDSENSSLLSLYQQNQAPLKPLQKLSSNEQPLTKFPTNEKDVTTGAKTAASDFDQNTQSHELSSKSSNDSSAGSQKSNSKSSGSLYRRSFISLRNSVPSSSSNAKAPPPVLPPRPSMAINPKIQDLSNNKESPLHSPTYGFFRRHQKTNSSESFLSNNKPKNNSNGKSFGYQSDQYNSRKNSNETLKTSNASSHSRTNSLALDNSRTQQVTLSKLVDAKFRPKEDDKISRKFVLVTKDKTTFFPVEISSITDVSTFQSKIANSSKIHHKNFQVYLSNYTFEVGETPLTKEVFNLLLTHNFSDGFDKFFVKDMLKIQLQRTRSSSLIKRKPSTRSAASSVKSSTTDDGSSTQTSGELASLEEKLNGQKAYPKTPNHYYENAEGIDYLTVKNDRKTATSVLDEAPPLPNQKSSFKLIRHDNSNKIDFNKKRETPFAKLEPKREAPKPPLTMSNSSTSVNSFSTEAPKMSKKSSFINVTPSKKATPLKRPPPPPVPFNANGEPVLFAQHNAKLPDSFSDSNISAFTPGSSQILVPQPYKGTAGESKDYPTYAYALSKKSSALSLRKKSSTASLKASDHLGTKLTRSNSSLQSSLNSVFQSPPRSLQRNLSRRVVSSASAADVFEENNISFDDAPALASEKQELKDNNEEVFGSVDQKMVSSINQEPEMSFTVGDDVMPESEDSEESDGIVWADAKDNENLDFNTTVADDSDSDDGIVWTKPDTKTSESSQQSGIIDDYTKTSDNSKGSDADDDDEDDGLIVWKDKSSKDLSSKQQLSSESTAIPKLSKKGSSNGGITRKLTLRPSPEVVYQNLEMFFPGTDLDKPVLDGNSSPASPKFSDSQGFKSQSSKAAQSPLTSASTIQHSSKNDDYSFDTSNTLRSRDDNGKLKPPKRTKTIRMVAHEAREARKKSSNRKLKRKNTTKLWGTKVVEITDKENIVAINKKKNSKGEYKEFAWLKGEMIGKGSFGCVFIGLNITTGEMMAIKQVEVPKYNNNNESTNNVVEALKMEVSTLKDLDHPNIVQYLGFEEKNLVYSLFIEYVAGGSVGSLIRLFGRFDDEIIRFLTEQVLKGLSYLHEKGILHRDMKADNLLLDLDGVCKISDFGISKKSKNIYSNADMTMRGTVFWMAPEMVDTKQGYSAKVDIWSLGCVVLEMFAGKRPWSNLEVVAAMFKIGKYKSAPPIPDDTLPLISTGGKNFLNSCFEIDPEKRPTAETLLQSSAFKKAPDFDFAQTTLFKFINDNDKMNSSKMQLEI
ncbi:hypothetical protein ACO0QE_004124 [Hanseniaspora vineae]